MAPPAPAAARPSPKTSAATAVVLMPTSSAEAGVAAAARIARPSQVLVRVSHSPTRTSTASTPPYTWALGREMLPTWDDGSAYDGPVAGGAVPHTRPLPPPV